MTTADTEAPTARTPRLSLMYPLMAYDLDHLAAFGVAVQDLCLERLYMGQSVLVDTHQAFAHLAGRGIRVPVGTSVALTALRHPLDAAVQARSLALLTGTGVVAGFGTGDPQFVSALRGEPYESPRTAVAEYLTVMRSLLDGEAVDFHGRYVRLGEGLQYVPHPPVALGVGVLRQRMAYTAGQVADVAITLLTPDSHLKEQIVPALAQGAASRDRAAPRVTSIVPCAVRRPGRDPRKLAFAAHELHLSGEQYAAMLRSAGLDVDAADPWAGACALVDGGVFAYGTPEEVADRLARYGEAGATEIALSCAGVLLTEGPEAALADVRAITEAMRDRATVGVR
ncbi:LLM class flavin-dependent oxidoreductase [Streptomyces sp. NBC_01408]|uniref:LLM class flavin-dependent oxidoreductase n=1 Tax=Streptomyces sp. NBC_01408 TaxID=2903855 RepID=UPI0022523FED|nr:LLM class flavin-dependent oxidoreductase [Streptomyces sp. NBC_01408]MCX4692049.1 LLM class flavin-dependent oxidoreductase [Streptomyces sp. NBC_01408]